MQDPGDRFCGQCGERRVVKDSRARGGRCGDCADHPVERPRFSRATGVRLNPPPAERAPLLSSISGPCSDAPITFWSVGKIHPNEGLGGYSRGRG